MDVDGATDSFGEAVSYLAEQVTLQANGNEVRLQALALLCNALPLRRTRQRERGGRKEREQREGNVRTMARKAAAASLLAA